MRTIFKIQGYLAFSEIDNWAQGCIGPSKMEILNDQAWSIESDSFDGLIDQLSKGFCATSDKDFLLNSCDEMGRLDLQVVQRVPFNPTKLSEKILTEWKSGKRELWLTNYSFDVIQVVENSDLTLIKTDRKFSNV